MVPRMRLSLLHICTDDTFRVSRAESAGKTTEREADFVNLGIELAEKVREVRNLY